MIHESIKIIQERISPAQLERDLKINFRSHYDPKELQALEETVSKNGILDSMKAIRKYVNGTVETILVDGFRRCIVLDKLGLSLNEQSFIVYEIHSGFFEDKNGFRSEDFEREYQILFAFVSSQTQNVEKWGMVAFGKAVLRLEEQGLKQVDMIDILNKDKSFISQARKLAMICENEEIANAYSDGDVSDEFLKKCYYNANSNIEEAQKTVLNYLNQDNNQQSLEKVETSNLQDIPSNYDLDSDLLDDAFGDFESEPNEKESQAKKSESKPSELEGLVLKNSDFSLKQFKMFVLELNQLSLNQQKAIISLVEGFINGSDINTQVIAYELTQGKLSNFPEPSFEIEEIEDESPFD